MSTQKDIEMEGINSSNIIQGITYPTNKQIKPSQLSQDQNRQTTSPPFITDISQMSQLFSAVQSSGESAYNELRLFHDNLIEAMKTGDVDAETIAENASDTLKQIAKEAGLDLVQIASEFVQHASMMIDGFPQVHTPGGKAHHGPPPPPPEDEYTTILGNEDSTYLEDILTDDTNL